MIYLASPYSHPNKAVERQRYDVTVEVFAALCRAGDIVISPIAMCHAASVRHGLPTDAAWWARQNMAIMRCCNRCLVLRLPGWEASVGVQAEIAFFEAGGLPVGFIDPPAAPDLVSACLEARKQLAREGVAVDAGRWIEEQDL